MPIAGSPPRLSTHPNRFLAVLHPPSRSALTSNPIALAARPGLDHDHRGRRIGSEQRTLPPHRLIGMVASDHHHALGPGHRPDLCEKNPLHCQLTVERVFFTEVRAMTRAERVRRIAR